MRRNFQHARQVVDVRNIGLEVKLTFKQKILDPSLMVASYVSPILYPHVLWTIKKIQ